MRRQAQAAWVIARRDYVATVWTRTFLLFLVTPLLPLLFGGLFATFASDERGAAPPITVNAPPADLALLMQARARLAARLGRDWLPPLTHVDHPGSARLTGSAEAPVLEGSQEAVDAIGGKVGLLVDTARGMRAGGPGPVTLRFRTAAEAPRDLAQRRRALARGVQLGMFFLTAVLAGMLISNLVEERSSKVIEVLAAAVPVDAVFLGKLIGMLGVSLTGIAVWGAAGLAGGALALPHGSIPTPAVGWPAFVVLVVVYWVLLYLLLGALYLGIGAQAGSVREVQTLSLPLTLGQVLFFGLAQAAVSRPDTGLGLLAAVVPWCSPFAFAARAAQQPALWPHLLGLGWQVGCLAVVVRVSARLFRRNVLKSGGKPRKGGLLSYMTRVRRGA